MSPILLIILGIIIKIYDDCVDNKVDFFKPFKEYFKSIIYILSYLALIDDLQLSGIILSIFIGIPQNDLADDNFWYPLGLITLIIFIYNLFYSDFNITLFGLVIFLAYIALVYNESRLITEEFSWKKLLMRIGSIPVISLLYFYINDTSIKKGLLIGGAYMLTSVIMSFWMHYDYFSSENPLFSTQAFQTLINSRPIDTFNLNES